MLAAIGGVIFADNEASLGGGEPVSVRNLVNR